MAVGRVVGRAMGVLAEPKTCLLLAFHNLWLCLFWHQHVETECRRLTERWLLRGREGGKESRPVPRGKMTAGKTFSNLCPKRPRELYLTHSRWLRVTRISGSQRMQTAQDTAGRWQTTKLTTIMIRIICELVWTIPRSCHKYLIKQHFKRLLRSHIKQVGDVSQELFNFSWYCDPICTHRLMSLAELGLQ